MILAACLILPAVAVLMAANLAAARLYPGYTPPADHCRPGRGSCGGGS